MGSESLAGTELTATTAVDTASFDFDTAIDAHRQWKVKLRKAIAHEETLDADTICRDDVCPLGQWIHSEDCRQWKARTEFHELISQHAEFHKAAADVARRINDQNYDEAKRMIRSGTTFTQISNDVCSLLTSAKAWR